jgi:hypothetical protein
MRRYFRLSERAFNSCAGWHAPQQPRLVPSAQAHLRGKSEAAHAGTGGGGQRGHEELRPEYRPTPMPYPHYRDTRFSKDKTPYKDHIAAGFRGEETCRRRQLLRRRLA